MHVAQFFDALALRPDIKIVEAALLDFSRKFGLREVRGNSGTDGCDPIMIMLRTSCCWLTNSMRYVLAELG